jgi:hypothetical protein
MTPQTTAAALQPDSGNQDAFIAAVIEAAEILRRDPLNFRHETPQGPVDLNVSSSTRGDWIARISGRQVGVMCRFGKLQHANEYLLRMFAELMPDHRCNRCCGGTQKPLSAP